MDVLMPDGTLVTGVPEGITQSQLLARYSKFAAARPEAATPILSPEEQVTGAAMAPSTAAISNAGIASLARPKASPAPYQPILAPEEQVMGAIGAPSDELTKLAAPQGSVNAQGQITSMSGEDYLAALQKRKEQIPERTAKGALIDTGVTLLKGAIGLPEAFVGLLDIPTLGRVGKFLQDSGYNPKESKEILDTYLSEAQQAAARRVSETKGFLPTIGAALENPSVIATSIGESMPQMLGGAGVARGILKAAPAAAPWLVGAVGEGVMGAGSAAEQIRQEAKDQLLSAKQALSAVGSGVGTAAFGAAAGRLSHRLGLEDIDTLLASGATKTGSKSVKDFAKRAVGSGISEGLFEELPQSAQEQMWMNYATDKPLMQGVAEAAGMGAITGAAMGAGANVLAGRQKTPQEQRAEALADALTAGAAEVTPNQAALDALVRKALSPEQGVQAGTNIRPQVPTIEEIAPPIATPRAIAEAVTPAEAVAPARPAPADLLAGLTAPPSESMDTEAMLRELLGEQVPAGIETLPPVNVKAPTAAAGLADRIGLPQGPARENAAHEEIPLDEKILLRDMVVKIVENGLTSGKTRQQIANQLETLTKGGISNTDFERIHGYLTEHGVKESPATEVALSGTEATKAKPVETQGQQAPGAAVAKPPAPVAKAPPVPPSVTPVTDEVPAISPAAPAAPAIDLIAESAKYDTPDLRLKQSDSLGDNVMGLVYSEMESHGRAALKNRSLTEGYAKKKDAMADAIDAATVAFGTNDYSVFQPYATLFPKTAAKLQTHFEEVTPAEVTPVATPVAPTATPVATKAKKAEGVKTVTPVEINTNIGTSNKNFSKEVLEPARQAIADGNFKPITLKDGTKVGLVLGNNKSDNAEGMAIAFDEKGKAVGQLLFARTEESPGVRFNPDINVDEQFRRKGLATALYDLAEEHGALIPGLEQIGQARTEQGQAFRESRAGKKLATEAPKVKPAKPAAKASPFRRAAYEKNPFLTVLATNGLRHAKDQPGSLKREFSPDKQIMVSGYGPVFKASGKTLDELLPIAQQLGYLTQDATESDLYDLVQKAVSGKKVEPVYSEMGTEKIAAQYEERMKRDRESYEERKEQTDAEWYGMSESEYMDMMSRELVPMTEEDFSNIDEALFDLKKTPASNISVRTAMELLGFTEEEIQNEERRTTPKAGEVATRAKTEGIEPGKAAPAFELETQTPEYLKAQQEEIDRLNKENERLKKEAEAKAKAEEEAGDFVLTGSNRAADVAAARGQKDIFAQEEEAAPEEEVKAALEKALGEPEDKNFYSFDTYTSEEEKKRSPSLKRELKTLNRKRLDGRITDAEYVERSDAAIRADEDARLAEDLKARQRGYLLIQEKLSAAARRGDISREAFDLANWFMSQNEDLVKDLGISIKSGGESGAGGFYNDLTRIFTVIKNGGSQLTPTHEILHHLERMMPTKVQQAIRKAWASQLAKAAASAKLPVEKLYFAALMDSHYGDNKYKLLDIPKGAEKAFADVRRALEEKPGSASSADFAGTMLKLGLIPMEKYEYFNPSEFWTVNGSDIVQARYDAVQGGVLAKLKNWLKEFSQKIKSLFGLKSDASIIRALDSLSKADGEFVTDEMLGQGDYYSLRNYKGNAAPAALWDSPDPSFLDGITYQLADKQIDTKRVVDSIRKATGQIDERLDAYTKESLYSSRSAARIEDFLKDKFQPLFEQMKAAGVTVGELETYLHNRHAEERNEQINKINLAPDIQDVGSGISTDAAKAYLSGLPAAQKAKLQSLAAKVDGIIEGTQKLLVDSGLETKETIDTWNKTYKHYIPLQRDDLDFVHTGSGYVGGVGTKGGASKRAVGSIKPVKDILANIAIQRERAIRRSEQATVGRALYGLAITSPNPGFWLPVNPNAVKDKKKLVQEMVSLGLTVQDAENLIQEPKVPVIDKATGLVKYQVNPALRGSDNVFPVRINGEDRFIIFNPKDERAMRMARSLKNLDADELDWFLGNMGAVTRWIAAVNTQYNPVFGAWNMARDVQSAAFNLSTTEIAGKEKEVLKGTMPAMFAIWNDLRGKPAKNDEQQQYMDLFNQMRLAGGTTGFAAQFSGQTESFGNFMERMKTGKPKEKVNIVEQELRRLNRGNVRKAAQAVFDWLSDYNDAMENAVRLSAFKVALQEGKSEQKAASIAKELTVNFNRKGASSPTLQALFAFFNAAVQGTRRLAATLQGPNGRKIIAGGITLGVIQAIVLAMNGYDDGDPPDFLKDKNFIIPIPFAGKNYIILPMPPGINVFPGMGRILTEAALIKMGLLKSNRGLMDKTANIFSLVLDSFNPLGAGSLTQILTPTALDPLFAIKANTDAFGRPIYKKDISTAETPGFQRSRQSATFISQGLSEFLNWASSPPGTKFTKGFVSPTADEIDYLAGQYFGGPAREVIKGYEYARSKVTGEEIPSYRKPIVGKLYGETASPAAVSAKFYDNVAEMAKHENEIKQRLKNKESTSQYTKDHPDAALWRQANSVENRVAQLNKTKKTYLEKNDAANAQRIEDQKIDAMRNFNKQVTRYQ